MIFYKKETEKIELVTRPGGRLVLEAVRLLHAVHRQLEVVFVSGFHAFGGVSWKLVLPMRVKPQQQKVKKVMKLVSSLFQINFKCV